MACIKLIIIQSTNLIDVVKEIKDLVQEINEGDTKTITHTKNNLNLPNYQRGHRKNIMYSQRYIKSIISEQ